MTENVRSNKPNKFVLTVLAGLAFASALALYYICYGSRGLLVYTVTASVPTKLWIAGIFVKYVLTILRNAALIWAGAYFARHDFHVKTAGRFWLLAIISAMILLLLVFARDSITKEQIYDQLLPLLRNTQPFVSGAFLFLLAQPYLRRWLTSPSVRNMALAILILPMIFNKDPFMMAGGTNTLGVFAFGCMGLIAGNRDVRIRPLHLLWFIPGYLGTILLAFNAEYGALSMGNSVRLIGLLSPLTVLPAMALVRIALDITGAYTAPATAKQRWTERSLVYTIWLTALVLTGETWRYYSGTYFIAVRDFLLTFMPHKIWLLVDPVIFGITVWLIASVTILLAQRTKLWAEFGTHWDLPFRAAWHQIAHHGPEIARRLWGMYWRPVVAAVALYFAQTLGALVMNQSFSTVQNIYNPYLNIFPFTFFYSFGNMLYGTIILLMIYWVLLALTDRYWLSLLTTIALQTILTIANLVKIKFRSEPIVPSDLAELKSSQELIEMLNPVLLIAAVVGIVLIVLAITYVERHARNANQKLTTRISKLVVALAFIVSLGSLNHSYSYMRNVISSFGINMANNNQLRFAQWNGSILQFVSGLDVHAMAKPTGYSKAEVAKVVKRYKQEAAALNKTRTNKLKDTTVIFNLSESFSDPTRIPNLTFSQDPIPYIRSMKQNYTSGTMMSYGLGGGTADMEYMTLTGLSLGNFDSTINTPYTQLVPKLKQNPNIGEDFNYASAIHPYTGSFYNRPEVYRKFKFNKFVYLGSKYKIIDQSRLGSSPYLSDTTAYDNALAQVNKKNGGQFINLITIQNHMPFNDWYKNPISVKAGTSALNGVKTQIETYATGTNYTDQAVKAFREKIDKINKPIVWVFYGDHLPGIYNGVTDQILLHSTDYFIYANKYAQEHGALGKQSNTQYVGPNDFIALALKQGNIKLNPYNALMTDVQAKLPAIWSKTDSSRTSSTLGMRFINESGRSESYKQLSAKQRQLLHDYQIIQYDISTGKQYSLKMGLTK